MDNKIIVNMHGVPAGLQRSAEWLQVQNETPAQRIFEGFERAAQDAANVVTIASFLRLL